MISVGWRNAAHSLGYWSAQFSHGIDTEAESAKVTVTVKPGPLSCRLGQRAGARRAAFVDPQDEKKLPLKLGASARTAPVVAAEGVLLASFGASGHPFANTDKGRVEIDNDT